MKNLLYLLLIFKKDPEYLYAKPFHKFYYISYETKPADVKDLNGEYMYYDEVFYNPYFYTEISKSENDSLTNIGYTRIEALNSRRAYKLYIHGNL